MWLFLQWKNNNKTKQIPRQKPASSSGIANISDEKLICSAFKGHTQMLFWQISETRENTGKNVVVMVLSQPVSGMQCSPTCAVRYKQEGHRPKCAHLSKVPLFQSYNNMVYWILMLVYAKLMTPMAGLLLVPKWQFKQSS